MYDVSDRVLSPALVWPALIFALPTWLCVLSRSLVLTRPPYVYLISPLCVGFARSEVLNTYQRLLSSRKGVPAPLDLMNVRDIISLLHHRHTPAVSMEACRFLSKVATPPPFFSAAVGGI